MNENNTLEAKKQKFGEEFNNLLKKYNYKLQVNLNFPEYKILPPELQLALVVIDKHKNEFLINFIDLGEKNAN